MTFALFANIQIYLLTNMLKDNCGMSYADSPEYCGRKTQKMALSQHLQIFVFNCGLVANLGISRK